MKTLKFNTNIMCSACIDKVTPILSQENGIESWEVDLKNPKRVLTVNTNDKTSKDIIESLKTVNYKAEEI